MDLLRFATAGSVDDGKSTLIGRLLYDTKSLFADQLEAVEAVSAARGDEYTNLALLTDGLRAEREQGITIDVAYRYFATPRRKFIIADTPGHIQYTRNMVTGASTADLALILVDARKGLVEQSRRHAFLTSRCCGCRTWCSASTRWTWSTGTRRSTTGSPTSSPRSRPSSTSPDLTIIPISALNGDNIASRSEKSPWYEGPSLLHHLEHVHIASDRNLVDVRFPVQYVIRPQSTTVTDYRGYAGQVASGVLKPGDEVMVLPSGLTSTIAGIDTADGPVDEAFPPMSVTVRLDRRDRHLPRRHDLPAAQRAGGRPGHRGDDLLDGRDRPAAGRREIRDQAHHPYGPRGGPRPAVPARREHAAPRRGRPASWGSTRSAGCGCAPRCRCSPTNTAATAPPAASS